MCVRQKLNIYILKCLDYRMRESNKIVYMYEHSIINIKK